ncbi:MAG: hypothetical protein OEV20_06870 [Actinomycetota bacterium]|nr:hypothetical protein [Actinomycetota bacterium]
MAAVTSEPAGQEPFTELSTRRIGPVRRFLVQRPRAMDAVVMLAFALPAAASVLFPYDYEPGLAALAFIAAGTAALAFRRRNPMAVAAAMGILAVTCTAATGRLSGFSLGIGFAVYAVAVARPGRTAWITAGVLVATTTLAVWIWEQPVVDVSAGVVGDADAPLTDDRLTTATGVVVFALVGLAAGASVRNRRLQMRDLVDRANALARDR